MNRFKKGKKAIPNEWSEFYKYSWAANMAAENPELWQSDRVRQEYVFCLVFEVCHRTWDKTEDQKDIISAVKQKIDKIQNNIPLDGTEPRITFEEFTEWNIRYPTD